MTTDRGRRIVILFAGVLLVSACSGKTNEPAAPAASPAAEASPAPAAEAPPVAEAVPTPASGPESFEPARAAGAVQGVPAPTNTAPIVAVANYYTELPGIDVAALGPRQREKFLQRINSELCTCGCKNDTLAKCYVNDPRCPSVKGVVQKIYEDLKAGR